MPVLNISDQLFQRLQKLAIPLVDTPASLFEKIVQHFESCQLTSGASTGQTQRKPAPSKWQGHEYDPEKPPDLRHTAVLAARFGTRSASGWNKLVHAAHIEATLRLGSLDALRAITRSNFIVGKPSSEDAKKGFQYVPEINISIQNVDAEHAWSNTLRLARHLRIETKVDFEWLKKREAQLPGELGRLLWVP